MNNERASGELRDVLAEAVGHSSDSPEVDDLMRALDRARLFRYHQGEPVDLISSIGRVLVALIEDPTLTRRAVSVYLGCSEGLVDKKIKTLVESGLITKTKINRRNVYQVNLESVLNHSDIQHLRDALRLLDTMEQHVPKAGSDIRQAPSPRSKQADPF
tara:strand:+ start:553 stop:1029 length:477 start_codon:yes stop_codon:yes gene_type:complete